jgi:hypothetical protein
MTLRLPALAAFAAMSLLVLDGCGPKRRGKTAEDDDDKAKSSQSLDHFDQEVALAREAAPKLAKGTAVVLRFFNATNNFKASMLFLDAEFPEKKESGRFLVLAERKDHGKLVATITILHRNWQPGQFQCDEDTQVAFGIGDHWEPQAPDTYVSWQPGAHCTLTLQEGQAPGDLEGSIRGEFVNNAGTHKLTIADGYLYMKQFQ